MTLKFNEGFAINPQSAGGGGGTLITKNITANGTYNALSDNADGYSSVVVNVQSSSPYYLYNVDFILQNNGGFYTNGAYVSTLSSGTKACIKTKTIKLADLNTADSWEICITHRGLESYSSGYKNILATIDDTFSGADYQGINYIYQDNRLNLFLGTGLSSWDIATPQYTWDSIYESGCTFQSKITYNNTTGYVWSIKNITLGDENFTTIATISNTDKIGQTDSNLDYYICLGNNGYNYNNSTTNGSFMEFDLANSYITIDGVTTYLAEATTTPSQETKTYNVDFFGKLINDDGIIHGISSGNYMELDFPDLTQASSWEVVGKAKITGGTSSNSQHIYSSSSTTAVMTMEISPSSSFPKKILMGLGKSNGSGWQPDTESSAVVQSGVWYWIKQEFTGSQFILSYSTDGETYTQLGTLTSSDNIPAVPSGSVSRLGYGRSTVSGSNNRVYGDIDLNGCYIKADGVIVWEGVTVNN